MNIIFDTTEKKSSETKSLGELIFDSIDDTEEMSDKDRQKMELRIRAKLKSGKKLSQKELNYLRKTNPVLYATAIRVQHMAKALEEQLKAAKSKEEANRIVVSAMSGISKDDPDREYLVAAVDRINTEFHKSATYSRLPDTEEDAKRQQSSAKGKIFNDGEEEDKMDLTGWTPLQEVIDTLPTFSANA